MRIKQICRCSFVLVVLLTLGAASAAAQTQDPGEAESLIRIGSPGSITSDLLGEERAYWVHLPESYTADSETAYPVMYLLDGEQHLGGLAAVQHYYSFFRLPEMIVVAVSSGEHRTRDLTPTEIADRNGAAVESSGGAAAFRAFLAEELIPHIDRAYRTTPHRVLIGHSFGGLFVIDTLLNQGDLFSNYVALDPSLDWDEGRWLDASLDVLSQGRSTGKGLFVAMANEIIRFSDSLTFETVESDTSPFSLGVRSQKRFVEAMEAQSDGRSFSWKFYEQDIHGSVPLVGMRDALVHIYDFWELKKPALYNDPETPIETVLSLIREQSRARGEGMGYPLPMEMDLLEMLGYFYADTGQTARARDVLALTAEYYPKALSLHEALVDLCLTLEDATCARDHARHADELTGTTVQHDRVQAALGDTQKP